MIHSRLRSLSQVALGVLLASGITAGAVAGSAQPAQAGVVVSVGFGGGYAPAPAYHWYRWHDGYGWHRNWVPSGWAPPVAYGPGPAYYGYPVRVGYGRPYGYARPEYGARFAFHDHDWHGYGHR
jgi:hypothetical protein